ncbi:MAG: DUF2975 domain-containing protein [Gammaproteobacteria bacterium]|nr:DUF2975 domain-containing protein [Gammaproteobacteria bacterium]
MLFLVPYLGFLYWLITKRYIPKSMVAMQPAAEGDASHRLARSSFSVLHFIHSVLFLLVILWLPVTIGILLHYKGDFGSPPNLTIYTNLVVDMTQIESLEVTGIREQVIRAKTEIALDAPNFINSFIFSVTQMIKLLMMLFVVLQLRNILASLCNGESFSAGNSQRLNWVGKVIVFAYIIGPIWNFFLSASVINTVQFSLSAITMTPTTDGSLIGLMVGVGILKLSPAIKEAEQLLDDQRHTI